MATFDRNSSQLLTLLEQSPESFQFLQAMRLLEGIYYGPGAAQAQRPLGYHHPLQEEAVFLQQALSLTFPEHDLSTVQHPAFPNQLLRHLQLNFMGLCGQSGPLPEAFTRQLLRAQKQKQTALSDFLNLFHHRLLSLYYRALEKNNPYCLYQRHCQRHPRELEALHHPDADQQLRYFYAGIFSQRPRNAANLKALIANYFQLPVHIETHIGAWYGLSGDEISHLTAKSHHNRLGKSLLLGTKIYSLQHKIRLLIGPLDYGQFLGLLPDHPLLNTIARVTRQYVGAEIQFEIRPCLRATEAPALTLNARHGQRLAWNSWLQRHPTTTDKRDVVFQASACLPLRPSTQPSSSQPHA